MREKPLGQLSEGRKAAGRALVHVYLISAEADASTPIVLKKVAMSDALCVLAELDWQRASAITDASRRQ